jgi:hypothetical protein
VTLSAYSPNVVEKEFSEVRCSKRKPVSVLESCSAETFAGRIRKRSALSTFVARNRSKVLRLATARLLENFGILRTSALRSSPKFASPEFSEVCRVFIGDSSQFARLAVLVNVRRGRRVPPSAPIGGEERCTM